MYIAQLFQMIFKGSHSHPSGLLKDGGMGCVYVTHLKLTNSRFCILYVKMNHFEAHVMVSSRAVDSKVLKMAIQFEYFFW